mmetsp:Transcript_117404/g.262419  ORF Transcript_117404/g.262419 Transcript_117404/m.262419 type:complete len:215 (+) Transcript_117404:96-740(+)
MAVQKNGSTAFTRLCPSSAPTQAEEIWKRSPSNSLTKASLCESNAPRPLSNPSSQSSSSPIPEERLSVCFRFPVGADISASSSTPQARSSPMLSSSEEMTSGQSSLSSCLNPASEVRFTGAALRGRHITLALVVEDSNRAAFNVTIPARTEKSEGRFLTYFFNFPTCLLLSPPDTSSQIHSASFLKLIPPDSLSTCTNVASAAFTQQAVCLSKV